MKTEPNEPIHPDPNPDKPFYNSAMPGLTKREYFAAMAMQGILSNSEADTSKNLPANAVFYTDKLIEELNKDRP